MGVNRRRRAASALLVGAIGLMACTGGGEPDDGPPSETAQRVAGLACSGGEGKGWCWLQPRPRGNLIADAWFVDDQFGWAVGEAGLVLHTVDGGRRWTQQFTGLHGGLSHVRFVNRSAGFAAGADGVLLHTADGGNRWTRWPLEGHPGGDGWIQRLVALDEREVLLLGFDQGWNVLLRVRNGQVRSQVRLERYSGQGLSIHPSGWASWRADGELRAHSMEAGAPVVQLQAEAGWMMKASGVEGPGQLWAMAGRQPFWQRDDTGHHLLMTDVDPVLLRTHDGGQRWQSWPVVLPPGQGGLLLWTVQIFADQVGWAWAGSGALLRSVDGGRTWSVVPTPPGTDSPSYWGGAQDWFIDSNTVRVVADGAAWMSSDAGQTWRPRGELPGYNFGGEALRPDGVGGLLTTSDAVLYRSTDGGRRFAPLVPQPRPSVAPGTAAVVRFADAQQGLMADGAALWRTGDGGRSWQHEPDPLGRSCVDCRLDLARPRDGSLWAIGGGRIARSMDLGRQWTVMALPDEVQASYYLAITSAQVLWAQAPTGLYRSLNGGAHWRLMDVPALVAQGVVALAFADADVGVVIAGRGEIWRSVDGGVNWQRVPITVALPRWGRIVWTGAREAWILGGGAAIRSTDAGQSWQAVALPDLSTYLHLNDIRWADARHGWIVGEQGLILATVDGGRSWVRQLSGTEQSLVSAWPADAHTLWVGGGNGTLLTSATGGR